MNNFLAKFANGHTVKFIAAVIGVIVAVSGLLIVVGGEEQLVLDRPASSMRSGNLAAVQRQIAGRDAEYYIITVATESGQVRCIIEPGYADAFDYDAFLALVPLDSVVEVTVENLSCASDSDLYPILSISSAGEEYLSYSDIVKLIGTVERKGNGVMGWLFITVGIALVIPLLLTLFNAPTSSSGKVIRTRRSSMPINSKYVK